MNGVAIGVALAAATGFAISSSLQHHAAGKAPESAHRTVDFVKHLLSTPGWLAGQVFAILSFSLHAVALRLGAIALVQPLVISGIILAVPTRALLSRTLPRKAEVVPALVATVGIGLFLVASQPTQGVKPGPSLTALWVSLVGLGIGGACMVGAQLSHGGRAKAGLLGAAAGVLFGVVAGLVKLVLQILSSGGIVEILTTWPAWLLLVGGVGGVVNNQRAYREASLSASLFVLNIVDVVVAMMMGLIIFDEVPAHTPVPLVLESLAMVLAAAGLWGLARVEEEVEEPPVGPPREAELDPEAR